LHHGSAWTDHAGPVDEAAASGRPIPGSIPGGAGVPPPKEPPPSSEILLNANGANDAFAGVGRFQGALTCTGSLIDPSGLGASDAKAWLLTAGHCISLEPYDVIRNQASTAQVKFQYIVEMQSKCRRYSTPGAQ
jgi:hypothetical protein